MRSVSLFLENRWKVEKRKTIKHVSMMCEWGCRKLLVVHSSSDACATTHVHSYARTLTKLFRVLSDGFSRKRKTACNLLNKWINCCWDCLCPNITLSSCQTKLRNDLRNEVWSRVVHRSPNHKSSFGELWLKYKSLYGDWKMALN